MMLYPPMTSLVDKVGSRYLLVNLVARRAREIATQADENGESMDEKPVSQAISEVYSGKLVILEQTKPVQNEKPHVDEVEITIE